MKGEAIFDVVVRKRGGSYTVFVCVYLLMSVVVFAEMFCFSNSNLRCLGLDKNCYLVSQMIKIVKFFF